MAKRPKGMADKAGGAGSTGGVKLLLVALTAVAIAAISAAAIFSAVSGSSGSGVGSFTPNDEGLLEPGSRAPEFTASSVDGGEVSLPASGDETATAAGKPTLLVFFATWCARIAKTKLLL